MKKLVVMALLSVMLIFNGKTVKADNSAMLSCSKGDRFNITLDYGDVEWKSSDENIVSIKDGIVYVNAEGNCVITNETTGFKLSISSSGESVDSSIIETNYNTTIDDAVVEESSVDVKTVEINNTVNTTSDAVPSDFEVENVFGDDESSDGDEVFTDGVSSSVLSETDDTEDSTENTQVEAKASSEGNYVIEDEEGNKEVIKVVDPKLNITEFSGSVGEKTLLQVVNVDNCTFESADSNIATVDEQGNVTLIGGGDTIVYAITPEGTKLECNIHSVVPTIDTDDVKIKKNDEYKIEIVDNNANLPVSFSIESGIGKVSDDGTVVMSEYGECVVFVKIGDNITYKKKFVCSNVHEDYFEKMQPAIQQCIGTPYLFGGETPGAGLDCSGYVSYVYRSVGLIGDRLTAQGFYDISRKVSEPQVGDMVFFAGTYDTSDYITHIGIYAGNGEMYHSGNPNQKVSLSQPYFASHLVGYGTLINDDDSIIDTSSVEGVSSVEYSQENIEMIWALVGQECSTDYEGALAVISCVMNRADANYGGFGTDPLSQLTAPGQFCYDPSIGGNWRARLGGNVDEFVKQAVSDCLVEGKRNHNYLNFRGNPVVGGVPIGDNWYF